MSALVEPSRDPSQPLTPPVATRHRRVGSFPDRQLEPRALLSSARGLFHREARIVPPSPRLEEPSPLSEKMEERLEAPSVVPNPLPASADPHGLSAMHTRRLAAPDRAIRRAVPVTFWRDACAPFRSAAGPSTSHSAARTTLPFSTSFHRPSLPIPYRDELLPSVSAALAVCDGLTRPPAARLSTVRGARARCVRPTSASHCFDYEHSRHIRSQLLFEACASPLRPRACILDDGDWGTWRFTTPDPLRRVVSGFCRGVFFRALPTPPCL